MLLEIKLFIQLGSVETRDVEDLICKASVGTLISDVALVKPTVLPIKQSQSQQINVKNRFWLMAKNFLTTTWTTAKSSRLHI